MLERLIEIFLNAEFVSFADVYIFQEPRSSYSSYIKADILNQLHQNITNNDYFKQRVLEESQRLK